MINLEHCKQKLVTYHASLVKAKIELADQLDRLQRAQKLKIGLNITEEELNVKKFAVKKALSEVEIQEHLIKEAKISHELAELNLKQTTIRSPIDGIVLDIKIEPGEFVNNIAEQQNGLVIIGNVNPLHLRVKIDDNDLWRFDKTNPAFAYLRSNRDINTKLKFIKIEPYAKSKSNIRGVGSELIDTRVVDVIYAIEEPLENLFIGQQLDVFIESQKSL